MHRNPHPHPPFSPFLSCSLQLTTIISPLLSLSLSGPKSDWNSFDADCRRPCSVIINSHGVTESAELAVQVFMTAWPEVCRGSRSVSTIVGHGGEWGGAGGRVVGGVGERGRGCLGWGGIRGSREARTDKHTHMLSSCRLDSDDNTCSSSRSFLRTLGCTLPPRPYEAGNTVSFRMEKSRVTAKSMVPSWSSSSSVSPVGTRTGFVCWRDNSQHQSCHRWLNKRTWGYTVSILKQLAKASAKSLCVFMCVLTALKIKINCFTCTSRHI